MRNSSREYLVEEVRKGYDSMAKDFAGTRMNFWHELTELVRGKLQHGDKILDLGCGNARFYREISDIDVSYNGCDISAGLVREAHKYHPELALEVCDARTTPYPDQHFDMVVSFAVVHHIPGRFAQEEYFAEVYRVLAPGGNAIVTSWNIWKTKKKFIIKEYFKNFFKKNSWKFGDTIMSFTHYKENRFVHAFTLRGLCKLAKGAGFEIEQARTIARASKKGREENFVLVLKKPL